MSACVDMYTCCRYGTVCCSSAHQQQLGRLQRAISQGPGRCRPLGADVSASWRTRHGHHAGASAHEESGHCRPAQPEAAAYRSAQLRLEYTSAPKLTAEESTSPVDGSFPLRRPHVSLRGCDGQRCCIGASVRGDTILAYSHAQK